MKRTTRQESNSRKKKSVSPPDSPIVDNTAKEPNQVIFIPPSVALSKLDRAPQLELSPDQLSVGFRMVRATHGVHNGPYFWECEILPSSTKNSHIRIGWSTRFGELQGPVGYDKCSFAYCDVTGRTSHARIMEEYGAPFAEGDIIGCFLNQDTSRPEDNEIRFFKNGVDQGQAYFGKEIPLGVYFPAVSLYGGARVRVNFGPSFIIRHDIFGANACSETQPMSPSDRKEHEMLISAIRANREDRLRREAERNLYGAKSGENTIAEESIGLIDTNKDHDGVREGDPDSVEQESTNISDALIDS